MTTHEGLSESVTRPLADRVAVVFGASRGIGAATARALAEAGAAVVVAARSEADLRTVAAGITDRGGRALAVPVDVTEPASVRRLIEQALGAYGRLDIAVNNAAGGGHRPTPLAEVATEDFDSALATSLRGVFLGMKYAIPPMLAGGGGSIVNMASTAGLWPVAGLAGYVSAKSGLIGLTRTAALDYASAGIRVNALAPGPIHTDVLDRAGDRAVELAARAVPLGRVGQPAEIAAAVVWLCSPAAAFLTGATLPIDGGMLAGMPPFARSGEQTGERRSA